MSEPEEEVETPAERFKANLRTILGAVLLAIFIRIVLFEAFEIDGPSMQPSLLNGDRVLVSKYPFGLFLPTMGEAFLTWGAPEIGDIVIVRSPIDNADIVKRVIAIAGDSIEVRDAIVYRNDVELVQEELGPCEEGDQLDPDPECRVYEEPLEDGEVHRLSRSSLSPGHDVERIVIPEGHVFVMGDHRDRSNDSTNPDLGPVAIRRIKGRVLFIYASYSPFSGCRGDRLGSSVE